MKNPILGLALSTVAFGASSVYLWIQLAAAQQQTDALDKANAELNSRLVALQQQRAGFAERRMAGGPGSFGAGSHVEFAGPPAPGKGPPPPDEGEKHGTWSRAIVNPPEMPEGMRKMMRANMRAQNKRLYFDLQSKLGLTADQTSELLDLLTDQQTMGFKGPRNSDPEQARDYWEAEQAKRKAAITDLLGAAKATQFEEYQKSMPSRSELMMLSQQLEGAETPLTDQQRSRMLDAMVEERERIPVPTYVDGTPQDEMAKTYDDWQVDYEKRVADQARSILTAEQLNTYNEYQQWQQQMRQQFATQGPPGGPPVRMRGGSAMFMPAPGGGVAFAVATDAASSSPTEKQQKSK
jgi:Txe/YoeB family toxin of Txe-Axe toxin-antitoxin module